MSLACIVSLSGCERDLETEGITNKITYYAVIEPNPIVIDGEEYIDVVLDKGADFTDPGAVVTEEGQEIEYTTTVTGTYFTGSSSSIDMNVPDEYAVTYSAVNKDGFPGSFTRNVTVLPANGDLVNSIEGTYTVTVSRSPAGGPANADYTDREYVYIRHVSDNIYMISDAIGGYYEFGRDYGPAYAATGGTIKANNIATNSFEFPDAAVVGSFGGEAAITPGSMSVNAAEKTITFQSTWNGPPLYTFTVTLKQVQL